MKPTPTQLKRLADLLAQPADSVEALAESVWETVTDLQNARDRHILFAYHPTLNVAIAYGPYNTDLQARRDAPKRIADTGGTQVRVVKLLDPESVTD